VCGVREIGDVAGAAVPPSGDLHVGDIDSFMRCAPSQDGIAKPCAPSQDGIAKPCARAAVETLKLRLRDEYRRWFAPASDANGPSALRLVHELRELIAGLGDRIHRMFHGYL
jgi:hypothetical protein